MSIKSIDRIWWTVITAESGFRKEIFDLNGNAKDLYIYIYDPISISKVYYKFWKPLEYRAEFQLHFENIDDNSTKIEVITYESEVFYWGVLLPGGDHGLVEYKKVPPTTIEEYEILLRIGNLVGEKNMPNLRLPKR